jgi:hypothetical protein
MGFSSLIGSSAACGVWWPVKISTISDVKASLGNTVSVAVVLALIVAISVGIGFSAEASRPSTGAASSSPAPVQGPYSPSIDPANFVSRVDNRYFPLRPGTTLRYLGVAEDGKTKQTDVVVVTRKRKRVLGVNCTVVRDTLSSHGSPVERTYDWYAQDKQGNVWYFGEDSNDNKNGRFVKANDSWQAGVDGAKPGIIMEGSPKPGDQYRQEYYPGHAEDQARILGSHGTVVVPFRTFQRTVETVERTVLEPGTREKKYYAAGIGEIKSQVVKGNHEAFALVGLKR